MYYLRLNAASASFIYVSTFRIRLIKFYVNNRFAKFYDIILLLVNVTTEIKVRVK